jgi:hypothetical protein
MDESMAARSTAAGMRSAVMNQAIKWLRVSYWAGAVIDALALIPMLSPTVFAATSQLPDFKASLAYRFAMGMGSALMLGWTLLLIWADRKPLERKGVLILTIIPVIAGFMANQIWSVTAHFLTVKASLPIFVLQVVLIGLLIFSYTKARRMETTR